MTYMSSIDDSLRVARSAPRLRNAPAPRRRPSAARRLLQAVVPARARPAAAQPTPRT